MNVRFSDLPIHPVLAAAIANRGFETATPVQSAVLSSDLNGRDLLVSSPTGSGKTLAFAALIAADLLPERGAIKERPGRSPNALVVAPTRELAAQVGQELHWLYRGAHTTIGTFTGGTPIGGDLRTLKNGVHIAVGTPGRLVDLHQRGRLDLAAIGTFVLDEADEMLDLGFKEDLECLLSAAPPTRRTLLFSATLPPEIVRLAARYQRDPLRVNTRPTTPGGAHQDITFVAHLIQPGEKLAAVVNLLLGVTNQAAASGKGQSQSIVFCRTRDRVSELHQRLASMGISAMAIAGDRSQSERDRALAAVRDGSANILVATNVAARGLDLPDVEQVIHADLPESVESLTHRSGRTGRAGRKGISIVIADLKERRKAERLLSQAGIRGAWTPAPGPEQIKRQVEQRLVQSLLADHSHHEDKPQDKKTAGIMKALRGQLSEAQLLATLLSRELARMPTGLPLTPVVVATQNPDKAAPTRANRQSNHGDFADAVVFRVNLGHETRAETRWLLPLICRRGGVTRNEIGAIRIGKAFTAFQVAAAAAAAFEKKMVRPDPRQPKIVFSRAPDGQAVEDARIGPRRPKPAPHAKPKKPAGRAPRPATRRATV